TLTRPPGTGARPQYAPRTTTIRPSAGGSPSLGLARAGRPLTWAGPSPAAGGPPAPDRLSEPPAVATRSPSLPTALAAVPSRTWYVRPTRGRGVARTTP